MLDSVGQSPPEDGLHPKGYSGEPINAGLFLGARITQETRFPFIISGKRLVVPQAAQEGALALDDSTRLRVGSISGITDLLVLRQRTVRSPNIPKAIYAGHVHTGNWSHWLLNFLPAVFAATRLPVEFRDFPLLVPYPSGSRSITFEESLQATWGKRPTTYIPRGEVKVDELVYVTLPFPHGPFGMTQLPSSGLRVHRESMSAFREFILREIFSPSHSPARVYLKRSNQTHNILHPNIEHQLISMLERYGFTAIELEKLGFQSQVSIAHNAETIIGIDGSAFANLLFCKEGAKVLSILPSLSGKRKHEVTIDYDSGRIRSSDFYGNIAALVGADLQVLLRPTFRGTDNKTYVHLDLEHTESLVRKFIGKTPR